MDALREIFLYWENLKSLSTPEVLHEYKALIWWWKKNQNATHSNQDERHYQRLVNLMCVKSILLMKGAKVDLQKLDNCEDITDMPTNELERI